MKPFITLLMLIFFANFSNAQTPNFDALWEKVENQESDGLPKSALEVVEQISVKAKKEANAPQQIKALIYKSKYALTLEEDAQLSIINNFKTEISNAQTPVKNVLENMLATLYWQYFQQHRYQFYNRTNTSQKVDTEDFRTWDLQTLFDEIHLHYQNSLKNGLLLQQTSIEDYNAIITEQKGSQTFRPTLFDLLSHNALSFYTTQESSITKPAYKFEIDDSQLISPAKEFASLTLTSKDSTSLDLNALKIYQDLIKFHLKDNTPFALVDVDIARLKLVSQYAIFDHKENLLLETLKASSEKWKSHEVSALYDFEIASIYNQQGNKYDTKSNPDVRWKIKEALELCNAVIQKYPNSVGAQKCKSLKSKILDDAINLTSETIIPNNQFSKFLVSYKNLTELDFSIYNVGITDINNFENIYREEEKLNFINKRDVTTQWTATLKDEKDYQTHSTEIVVPKLENGHYIILAKTKNDSKTFAVQTLQVTDFAVVDKSVNTQIIYQIIDRTNGSPQSNVSVEMRYKTDYNSGSKLKKVMTDSQGFIILDKNNQRYMDLSLALSKDNKTGYFNGYYAYNYGRNNDNKTNFKPFLFTDRSIYRPGQTLFFKGIATTTTDNKTELYTNQAAKVTLKNVNGEVVKELNLKTNDYGSVHGEFIIPNSGLTGNFTIEMFCGTYGYANMSVEEYKRPKFETTFQPVTKTFKVNDSVTVKGNALAFAGSNITDAKVVYRVTRKVQYPRWYYWYRPYFNSEPQEITNGETTTNDKGEFEISFIAQPDESVDKSTLPIFQYEITADVTDVNGETRSETTIVNVGYHVLLATIMVSDQLDKTSKDHKITIDTKNLNGEFIAAEGSLKIYKLKAPNRVLRSRPWQAPDYQLISQEEFIEKFPHEAYKDEANPANWDKGELVFETTFDTGTSKEIALNTIKKWESGQYSIELESKDRFGQLVKAEARTTLFSEDDSKITDNELFSITTNKTTYKAGENVQVTIASAAKNVTATISVEKDYKIIKTFIVPLNDKKQTLAIPVNEEDLGGFSIQYSFAAFNSFRGGNLIISVPYPKTNLEIETVTFRDKLQPGTDETWSFKIKGPKGEKVSAEILTSMYDASLDQFKSHSWDFNPIDLPTYRSFDGVSANQCFGTNAFRVYNESSSSNYNPQYYDQLNWFGFYFGSRYENKLYRSSSVMSVESDSMVVMEETEVNEAPVAGYGKISNSVDDLLKGQAAGLNVSTGSGQPGGNSEIVKREEKQNFDNIKIRKNLNETAFFFPQLQTDAEGNVSFSFTTPEALTKWKLQLLAHTKTLESAIHTLETVTQKELMVIPNAPRFLREGDRINISAKISNLTDKKLFGSAKIILTDAVSGEDISEALIMEPKSYQTMSQKYNPEPQFSVDAKGNTQVNWTLNIPYNVDAVQYKILAKAGDFSDGEQNALPVLSNRTLVTETLPMWIKSNETKTFTLDKLATTKSTTLKHHKLTLEMTSNPAWYAVQALPYLMEYPYDCNEQTFSRYYANALASHIANSNPRIQEVFNQWRNTDALLSNLEKNQELKSILIQETPWLRDAQSETEQKKRIALLFDLNKMNNELSSALGKLKNNQMSNGAWPWFKGGRPNRFITQHIITGFGHLDKLNVVKNDGEAAMIEKAIAYLDAEFVQEYKDIRKYDKDVDLSRDHLSYTQLHYLYMRSFFPEMKKSKEVQEITDYYQTQIQKYWLSRSLYAKGLMALVVDRMNDKTMSAKILKSLRETSITSEELGMYWKSNTSSWHWYQAPIETHALMIEAFAEIENDTATIDNLKIWLLKNKQTNKWSTTKATTEAVYALLLQGSDWLSVTEMVDVVLGGQQIEPSKLEDVKVEAGTGYYKTSWSTSEIKPEMATVKLTKKGDGIAWGALYWQYFEDLDKITSAETPLKLSKKLFKKTNTETGEQITEITNNPVTNMSNLKVGDLVRVRIELRCDRDMEFIHMKDMLAAGLEPINVLSQYKYQDGLGYYESTKDASTNFFFDFLPKGVYVFEYDLRINNAGDMSNGITTIQSMYAPEFSSHSEGVKISVNK
ncbi:alpha-2-macroglobulin family protein [Psychroserpens sp. Hel_I_66]|uniref:alpha-2-macroglobulin family protein n=1 Tax=Psychroserpens sp. Hel_I_66 TaxID=1250004 RepID=UPI000647CC5E|nr:MG2 domain-containing protein [Psychroserpens sp. Hel_I_66]